MKENRELLEQSEKNMNQKGQRNTCGNAAAGLIVLPTRSSTNLPTQNNLTNRTTQANNVNGDNVIPPQQSIANNLTPNQKHDVFSSKTTTIDPFASFPSSNPIVVTSTVTTNTDLFVNFSPNVLTSINHNNHNPNPNFPIKSFPSSNIINSTASNAFTTTTNSSMNTMSSFPSSSSGDKYAALAELDGLFKSTSLKSTNSETTIEQGINDQILSKTNMPSVSVSSANNQWVSSFTPQITYSNNPTAAAAVVVPVGAPSPAWSMNTTAFNKDTNIQSFNPFTTTTTTTNPTVRISNPSTFNRFPNPFTNYPPVMGIPSSMHQFPEALSSESKNPFLANTQQSFINANPFSNLMLHHSTTSAHYQSQITTPSSFSPMMMHPHHHHSVNNFPTKMNYPMNGMVGQTGSNSGLVLDNTMDPMTRYQMSNFNPF
ncbi:unnamed protein product [Schistosoma turkestanicum]|nr:unnamed protein product [Schistosoma turkestanicum]